MPRTIYSDEHERLCALLRRLRHDAGLTQVELSQRLGRSQSFVSKYEQGQRRLDLIELEEIALALGTTLEKVVRRFVRAR